MLNVRLNDKIKHKEWLVYRTLPSNWWIMVSNFLCYWSCIILFCRPIRLQRNRTEVCNIFSFGQFPGVWVLIADVSEPSISSIFIGRWMKYFIHLPMRMELIEGSETSAIRTQTPGNYPKENILHIEHGESLKSRGQKFVYRINQLQSSDWYLIPVNIVIILSGWKPNL